MGNTPNPASAVQPTVTQKNVITHFKNEYGAPTKGYNLAIIGLIYCMMEMSQGMNQDKSLIDQQLNEYVFAQNLNGAKSLGDVYRVCMDYVISGNPEARQLVSEAARLLNFGHNMEEKGLLGMDVDAAMADIVQTKIAPQLKDILNDAKGKPQSEAMKTALSFVTTYAQDALEEMAGVNVIDPHTATIQLGIYTNMGQQMENSTKERIGELKNLASNLKEIMQDMMTLTKANQQQ